MTATGTQRANVVIIGVPLNKPRPATSNREKPALSVAADDLQVAAPSLSMRPKQGGGDTQHAQPTTLLLSTSTHRPSSTYDSTHIRPRARYRPRAFVDHPHSLRNTRTPHNDAFPDSSSSPLRSRRAARPGPDCCCSRRARGHMVKQVEFDIYRPCMTSGLRHAREHRG